MPSITLFYWVMCMTIDLSSEFSSSDKIRLAVFFSAHGILGRAKPVAEDYAISKPVGTGAMGGNVGYLVVLHNRQEYEVNGEWLFTKAGIKPHEIIERRIYAENSNGFACSFHGCEDISNAMGGDRLILNGCQSTRLELNDRIVDRHGNLMTIITEKRPPKKQDMGQLVTALSWLRN